jgi:ATP-dependent protease ClpP protease subunit
MSDHPNVASFEELPQSSILWEKNKPYRFGDFAVVIEFLAGETRTKMSSTGIVIDTVMPVAYGFILGTTDAHGEEIDVYIADFPNVESVICVIDQITPPDTVFDEHKVMIGFDGSDEAMHLYCNVFADGSGEKRLGAVSVFSPEDFTSWLKTEGSNLKPAVGYAKLNPSVEVAYEVPGGVRLPNPSAPHQQPQRDESGGVVVTLPDMSKGPKLKTVSNDAGGLDYHLYFYSGLMPFVWSNAVDAFCRTLDLAKANDVVHIHIASPGGSVFLMGRMVSAIHRTAAKVVTYAEGCVASAATSIWAAGHERHIFPGSFFMQHMSSQLLAGKTTDIAAKSTFCMNYIQTQLEPLVSIGLFTQEEVDDMTEKSADIYIEGTVAIERVGAFSKAA